MNVIAGGEPLQSVISPLPVRDLGRVFAVQLADITSLVRITPDTTSCDCAFWTAHHQPCVHIALAARLSAGAA